MRNGLSLFVVASVLVLFNASNVWAQEIAARHTIGATVGAVNFDLSGIGFAHQSRDGSPSVTNLALSTAGGLRAYVDDRVALIGEFRLRGIQRDFSATTAEIMGGVSFDIGR